MNHSLSTAQVIVVGAGIAGLTAAYSLKEQGISVKVIDAADRVGGRMTSDELNGHVVDRGAQFLSSEYSIIAGLLKKLKIDTQLCATSQRSAIVRHGQPRILRTNHPLNAMRLLGLRSVFKLGWRTASLRKKQHQLSLSNYSTWAAFDNESTSTWSNTKISHEVTEYLYEPMLHGFYFQRPEETSKALALALTMFGMKKAQILCLKDGMSVLPETLSQAVDVTLNTPVHKVEWTEGQVYVYTSGETYAADAVIIAVPAPYAKQLLSASSEIAKADALLATPYSSSINVACVTQPNFQLSSSLANVYGVLIPRSERAEVVAIGIENNKNRAPHISGNLFNFMFSHEAAQHFMQSPDEDIVAAALAAVSGLLPNLASYIAQTQVYRWPLAEPLSQVGRAQQLQAYRAHVEKKRTKILLAGDYMSMPYTEGAAESGWWAAQTLAHLAPPCNGSVDDSLRTCDA